jgi:hypothetical protein
LVTAQVTLPVGFAFYLPDPAQTQWEKTDNKLKKKGIPKSARPLQPPKNDNYPTKLEIALRLLEDFKRCHPTFKVKVILADDMEPPILWIKPQPSLEAFKSLGREAATKIFITVVKRRMLRLFLAIMPLSLKNC